jgi:hypothetical protein
MRTAGDDLYVYLKHFHASDEIKVAFFHLESYFKDKMYEFRQSGSRNFLFLKQKLMSVPIAMAVDDNYVFFEVFDNTVQWMIAGGIVDWAKNIDIQNKYRPLPEEIASPKMLTFDDLSHGFAIYLGFCGVSLISFLVEKVSISVKQWISILVGKFLFYKLLKRQLILIR